MGKGTQTAWAFKFFAQKKADYASLGSADYVRVFSNLIGGRDDPPFLKAIGHIADGLERLMQRERVLSALADVVSVWNLKQVSEMRDAAGEIETYSNDIARCAEQLARKIEAHERLVNQTGITPNSSNLLSECIEAWANHDSTGSAAYQNWVSPELEPLFYKFNPKYWPNMSDLIRALGQAYEKGINETTADNVTASACRRELSVRSMVCAFLERLDNEMETPTRRWETIRDPGMLPAGFTLSPTDTAALLNCALALYQDDAITADNIRHMPEFKNRTTRTRFSAE